MMILPHLFGKRVSYWNTNQWAMDMSIASRAAGKTRSEYLDHNRKERLSEHVMRVMNVDALYGGYMEDRSFLWKGSYMEPSKFRHLGIDIVAKAGSRVCIDVPGILLQVYDDTPEEHGWGTRMLFKIDPPIRFDSASLAQKDDPAYDMHLVFGHLAPVPCALDLIGNTYKVGECIGALGTPEQNGGWSSHLHVQAILGDINEFIVNPALLDGYGELDQIKELSRRYPDPTRFIKWV